MIKLTKSNEPSRLKTKGKKAIQSICNDYDSGKRTFDFDKTIYNNSSVKKLLKEDQNEKCCYCENKFTESSSGDVEHYRPKNYYQQKKSDTPSELGYYWLVYDWNNLFFSCEICNRLFKKNLFPLKNSNKRAKKHNDKISLEKPLIINPYEEDPKKYISFRAENVYAKEDNMKGKKTIEVIGLNRNSLSENRLNLLKMAKILYKLSKDPNNSTNKEAKQLLKKMTSKESKYSYMIKSAIKNKFANVL